MFPLSTVLFPYAELPLRIFEPRYHALYDACMERDGDFGVVMIERGSEVGGGEVRSRLGTVASIEASSLGPAGQRLVRSRGGARIDVVEWLPDDPFPRGVVHIRDEAGVSPDDATLARAMASVRRARALLSELGEVPPLAADAFAGAPPGALPWVLCAASPLGLLDRQHLLGLDDPAARLGALAARTDEVADDLERLLAAEGS